MERLRIMGQNSNENEAEVAAVMNRDDKSCHRKIDWNAVNRGPRIVINISGQRYETYEKTLELFPESLLGDKERRKDFYDPVNNEFFFDRNRICFESILAYYQTNGILIRPQSIPRKVFISDVRFFDLGPKALVQAGEGLEQPVEQNKRLLPKNKIQRKVWELFEHPDTSNFARGIAIWSVCIIILSIALFCVETLPQFQEEPAKTVNGTVTSFASKKKTDNPFFLIEAFCITWFTLEYVIRFIFSPNKWKFFISVLNMIDLVSIIPFYITLPMEDSGNVSSLAVLRSVRLVRVFRIFKLSRYSRGLQILGHTLRASLRELGLLFFFLCMGVVLFSSAVYYAEISNEDGNDFLSIPHSFWWAIITMTTVGYGDITPKTLGGKLVGCFCAITGVLAIALPVPVIVSNFAYYYSKENDGRHSNMDGEDEDDEIEQENEPVKKEKHVKKKISLNCTAKICRTNRGNDTVQIKRKRKFATVNYPDTLYNALDSNANKDHQNGLANANPVKDENDQKSYEKETYLSQVETIV